MILNYSLIFFKKMKRRTLLKKRPYSVLFRSVFSRIRTESREILRISPYSIWMRGNTDQNNSEYGHFLCSGSPFFFSDNVLLNEMNLPVYDRNHKVCSTFSFNFVFKNIFYDMDWTATTANRAFRLILLSSWIMNLCWNLL